MASKRASSGRLRDVALSKIEQKRKALEKARQQLEIEIERDQNKIHRINDSLEQNRVEYGKIFNQSSPLLNLPTEVTCIIFHFSVTCHVLDDPREEKQSLLPEVVISHVCKRWRDVAINHPPLWTRFCFALDKIGPSMVNSLARFDAYIERSGSRNLELFLDFSQHRAETYYKRIERPPITEQEQRQLLDTAIKHIHRWKTVTLITHQELRVEDHFTSLLMASAPNLEHFVYSPCYSGEGAFYNQITSLTPSLLQGGTPNLRYLLLNGSARQFPSFSNVTTLRIEFNYNLLQDVFYSMESFLEMLLIPSLANLSISGYVFNLEPDDHIPIITMNNLQHLRYKSNQLMTFILPFIRAPLLQTLVISTLDSFGVRDYEDGPNIPRATENPYFFPSLHTLSVINFSPIYPSAALRIMRLSENIKTITVSHDKYSGYQTLLETLRENGSFPDECWPNLTCINLNIHYRDHDRMTVVEDFIRSRPKKTIKLRLFEKLHSGLRPSDLKAMKKMCPVEVLDHDTEMALRRPSWPPGVDFPHEQFVDDPFHFSSAS